MFYIFFNIGQSRFEFWGLKNNNNKKYWDQLHGSVCHIERVLFQGGGFALVNFPRYIQGGGAAAKDNLFFQFGLGPGH